LPPYLGLKNKLDKKSTLLAVYVLLGLFFDPEDDSRTSLLNIGGLLLNCMELLSEESA
jgi:hypothetical protein